MLSVMASSIAYIVEGVVIVPFNIIFIAAIVSDSALRKRQELVFITSLAVADGIYGAGTVAAGWERLIYSTSSNETQSTLVSPLDCYFRPKQLLLNYSSQVSVLMLIAISVERIIAILWFQHFAQIRYKTAVLIAILSFVYSGCTLSLAGYEAYLDTVSGKMVKIVCLEGPAVFKMYESIFKISLGLLSVVCYGIVLVAYKKRVAPLMMPTQATHRNPQLIRQRRLTQTLSILTCCTLVFFCIPHATVAIFESMKIFHFNTYLWIFIRVHCLSHVAIFLWRYDEIRNSVLKFCFCFGGLCAVKPQASASQGAVLVERPNDSVVK